MLENAKKSGVFKWNYQTCTSNDYKNGAWEQEKFRTLYTYCLKAVQEIDGNVDQVNSYAISASPGVVAALESIDGFEVFNEGVYNLGEELHCVGMLGRFTVYRDMFAREDYILVAKTLDSTLKTITESRLIEVTGLDTLGLN